MIPQDIIKQLSKNKLVFESHFKGITTEQSFWKPLPDKWNMLEVVCHLVDEEKYDFRTRVKSVLEDPGKELPGFNPLDWVLEHKYLEQDFKIKSVEFLEERQNSIFWLTSLNTPLWKNEYFHPKMGPVSAEFFLANWLAHDYIHIRQLNRLAYEYLQFKPGVDLSYAGNW